MDNRFKDILERNVGHSKKVLRKLIIASFTLGINVTAPSRAKDSLKLFNIFLVLCSSFGIYGQYCYVMLHIHEPIAEYIECFYESLQLSISLIKMIYCLFAQRRIYKLLHAAETGEIIGQCEVFDMDLPIRLKLKILNEVSDILHDSWLIIRRQLVIYACPVAVICGWFVFVGLKANPYHKFIGTANYTLQGAFPSYFPILESKGFAFPYFELQYIIPCVEVFVSGMGAFSFDGIFIVLTVHCTALLRILNVIIRYSTNQSIKPQLRVKYLRHCIQHFQRTYKYYDDINSLYGIVSLSQFGLILFVLGMVLFQANIALEADIKIFFKMVFHFSASCFEVFLYCFNGQRLTTESEKLNFSWYDCDWYQESKEFKELIKMMILRSNRIMLITVSGFTSMSLMTFLSIINTSGSYFLMLKNTLSYKQES